MKKAAIYDPYLDTLGGGERYMMAMAGCLSNNNYQVDILWDGQELKEKLSDRFGIDLGKINFTQNVFKKPLWERFQVLKGYQLVIYLSDGSIPFLFGQKNILHFQVPFHNVGGRKPLNQFKLKNIQTVICNSFFTKKFIDMEYSLKSSVIYPPVELDNFKPGEKKNIILYVGRFTDLLHNKRQDVLVGIFKKMFDQKQGIEKWKLVLAGGAKEGKKLLLKLKDQSKGYPVDFFPDVSLEKLKGLYSQAKIFWSATGFGFDEKKEPEKMEHFGITTAESMAAGCVPVVTARGGQKEIVDHGVNGFLWDTQDDLIKQTQNLLKNKMLLQKLSQSAIEKSKEYSQERFCEEVDKIVS